MGKQDDAKREITEALRLKSRAWVYFNTFAIKSIKGK